MEKFEEGLEKLKAIVESVQIYFTKPESYNLEHLVTAAVCPMLEKALTDMCPRIEERHKIEESQSKVVIHYTSITALVSMLENVSKGDNKSPFRLYDSAHFNDPDEGNYLARNLLQKYSWLGEKGVRHAYVASFILPNSEKDISDNLVFWRTYGREGEGLFSVIACSTFQIT